MASWPHGDRPRVPFPYWDEVMTGFEYQAAAHMIYEGLVEEGLEIIVAASMAQHAGSVTITLPRALQALVGRALVARMRIR